VASARSALQAIFLKCHGWVVDEELAKEEPAKKQICNTQGKYWCEEKEMADWTWDEKTENYAEKTERSVCSALQSIWLHAGTGSANQRFQKLFGLKWKEAGSEKPSTGTEIKTTCASTTRPAAADSFKWFFFQPTLDFCAPCLLNRRAEVCVRMSMCVQQQLSLCMCFSPNASFPTYNHFFFTSDHTIRLNAQWEERSP
jgi:hypothetical protein